MRAPIYLLDTNALSELSSPSSAEMRRHVRSAVARGRVDVLTSWTVLHELLVRSDRGARAAALRLLLDLSRDRVLVPPQIRIPLEAERRGMLGHADRFLTAQQVADVLELGDDAATVQAADADRRMRQAAHVELMKRGDKDLRGRFNRAIRRRALDRFADHAGDATDDWCRDFIREQRIWLRLPETESRWPAPRCVPSLWRFMALRLARIYWVHSGQVQPDENDEFDAMIYSDTVYADFLVTKDGPLTETIALAATPRPRVLGLIEWVETVRRI